MVDSFFDRTKIGRINRLAKGLAMPISPYLIPDRIVRTDFYFDGEGRPLITARGDEKLPPSIGTAWIANPKKPVTSYAVPSAEMLHLHDLPVSERFSPEEMIEAILQGINPRQIIEFSPREIVAMIHVLNVCLSRKHFLRNAS